MKLLAPDERCSGAYRTGPGPHCLWPVCLRCARLHPKARQKLGTVYLDPDRVATCDEVLYDGGHASQSERRIHTETSLPVGGVLSNSAALGETAP